MTKEVMDELRNRAFQAKTQEEWGKVMEDIKNVLEGEDDNTRKYLRQYCGNLLQKKKEYWSKYAPKEKKTFPVKNSFIFQDNLAEALAEYITVLTLEKKLEIKNKFNVDI